MRKQYSLVKGRSSVTKLLFTNVLFENIDKRSLHGLVRPLTKLDHEILFNKIILHKVIHSIGLPHITGLLEFL